MINTSVSFNVVWNRFVQFSCDHILTQVPIIEKNAWEIAVHGERKEKKRTIMHVYKIQDISSFFLHIYMPQSTNEKKKT